LFVCFFFFISALSSIFVGLHLSPQYNAWTFFNFFFFQKHILFHDHEKMLFIKNGMSIYCSDVVTFKSGWKYRVEIGIYYFELATLDVVLLQIILQLKSLG